MTKHEVNAMLELLKRHAKAVSKEQYIEDIEAMQARLDGKEMTEKEKDQPNPSKAS